jgi:hypothetical protein
MPTVEFNDDKPALEYIRKRGYASYSSIKNVRDCVVPSYTSEVWHKFGKELHSRFLEGKKIATLSKDEERQLAAMLDKLDAHPIVRRLLAKSKNEVAFGPRRVLEKYNCVKSGLVLPDIMGVPVLGYIDIHNEPDNEADLKTTRLNNMKAFVASMDFLQPAIYLEATRARDFYYIGICKQTPYNVMVFSVKEYPERMAAARAGMKRLLKYIKSKL